jgi:hypothetical protein
MAKTPICRAFFQDARQMEKKSFPPLVLTDPLGANEGNKRWKK